MTSEANTSDKLIDKLPLPLRRLVEAIGIFSAVLTLVGWLASTFSLIGKMTFWHAAWAFILSWSLQFPAWVENALIWIGAQAHWIAETFRALVYPIVRWLFQWLPFEIPPIALDIISIALFGVFGAARLMLIWHRDETGECARNPISWASKAGFLFPIALVQTIPFFVFIIVANRISILATFLSNLIDSLEERVGVYWANTIVCALFGLPFLSAFPLSIFLFEWIYVTFLN